MREKWILSLAAGIVLVLSIMVLVTAFKLRQETPLAPTAPQSRPQAVEPQCQLAFTINLPSPTPTPTPTPSPTPSASPSPTPTPPLVPSPSASPPVSPTPTPKPTPSPSLTPTPSPSPGAVCSAVQIYRVVGDINDPNSWQLLTSLELTALQPGELIYVATYGETLGVGNIDRARIRVNTNVWLPQHETTNLRPRTDGIKEFYVAYIIPSDGTRTFTFESEIHEQVSDVWK